MPNRLLNELSPYLLQHANNPVDWYPWGPEALERSKREDKPILLSIGYSACHWCHVMEHESFENVDIAQLMNELFVNVKVDREERPDLDQIYQLAIQVLGRSGGWPLTVFLTPDQRPFFAGTYFPPVDRRGMPGFPRLCETLAEAYRNKRGDVEEQAQELAQTIDRVARERSGGGDLPGPDLLQRASKKLLSRVDEKNGGFGSRPKFPNTMAIEVLLQRGTLEGDGACLDAVTRALDGMRDGGIWDHLRGGFHRYSTDERWLVPHFEKMLYDNALLLGLYVDGYRVFQKPHYAATAREIVGYLFAEMRDAAGAFYASQDADSEGHEGLFFVWTPAELEAVLSGDTEALEVARHHFGVTKEGNFEQSGASVLHAAVPLARVAETHSLSEERAFAALDRAKARLLESREGRPRPSRDDKVLASWNGLLISALADAGRALHEPSWVKAAEQAFAEIERGLVRDGRVGRYLKNGAAPSAKPGFLDDQAYIANAALDLYEATGNPRYARSARAIATAMVEHHLDRDDGGFFFTPDDADALIARTKDAFDPAVPAATSMAALVCLRVGAAFDASFTAHGEAQLKLLSSAPDVPLGMSQAVLGLARLSGSIEVVLVGPRDADTTRALADACFETYQPNRSLVYLDPSDPASLAAAPVLAEGKTGRPGVTLAYVCRGQTCSAPVTSPDELRALLLPSPAGLI